jgi:glycosyltransferase involved in cell wall biosynthesis
MHIGIDLRSLEQTEQTGVGVFTRDLVETLATVLPKNSLVGFVNKGSKKLSTLPQFSSRLSTKLLNTSLLTTNHPHLDRLLEEKAQLDKPLDFFISPNSHFTSISPQTHHILVIHDIAFALFKDYYTLKQRLWHRLVNPAKQSSAQNTHLVVPSHNTKRDVVDYFNISPEKITVIYPGTPLTKTEPSSTEKIREKYNLPPRFILALGTNEPRKNTPALLQAYEQAAHKLPLPYALVIAGATGWKNTATERSISQSAVKKNIHMIGYVDETDKGALLREASLCIYPSFYEGFGFPALEAMQAGTPVIASNRSSLMEVTGASAYAINPHHPEEIAEGIFRLLTDTQLRNNLIAQGKTQADLFSWKKAGEEWAELFKRLQRKI